MTIEELGATPMVIEAERISEATLRRQTQIETQAVLAEQEAREELQNELGVEDSSVGTMPDLVDTRILRKRPVISPLLLEEALPLSKRSAATTRLARAAVGDILRGDDDRLVAIVGPCSIHDGDAALEYAEYMQKMQQLYGDDLVIIMRTYPEKPRSELGWKGLVNDPRLDGSYDLNLGLTLTRLIAGRITDAGVPIAMERLNALTPQYVNGLVAYDAIGARNVTDQKAREYASGTSSPVGFKNAPDGSVEDAVSAVVAANNPHTFLGTSMSGMPAIVETTGNNLAHVILRGGKDGPNYYEHDVRRARQLLADRGLLEAIIVDASHGNSGKLASRQRLVVADIARQIQNGQSALKGIMLESNLVHGSQKLGPDCELEYGKSITDACIGLEETSALLGKIAQAVVIRRRTLSRSS